MPQLAPISLNDGASTPVAHTFDPKRIEDGILATLEESVGVPALRKVLTVKVRPPVNGNGYYRATIQVRYPVARTPAGGDSAVAAGLNTSTHEFVIHELSTEQEIKDLVAFGGNAIQNSVIKGCVTTLTPFY